MLQAAILIMLAADSPTRESQLSVLASTVSGASIQVSAPSDESKGLVVGARVGLHASRPPITNGGGRLGLVPTITVRHDFGSNRTEWTGAVALSVELWKLRLLSGIGYGLTAKADLTPQPLLEISVGGGIKFGWCWVGLQLDTLWRLGTPARALNVTVQLGFELDLLREEFD